MYRTVCIMTRLRLRETWNQRFKFSYSGLWLGLLEMVAVLTIILVTLKGGSTLNNISGLDGVLNFLVSMTLLITLGNGYMTSERLLFGNSARVDRLMVQRPEGIVLSSILSTYLVNLRPTLQSPTLIALVLAHLWSPQLQPTIFFLLFLIPLLGSVLAICMVILVKRAGGILSGMALLISTGLQLVGWVVAIWFLATLSQGFVPSGFWNGPGLQWWIPLLLLPAAAGGLLVVLKMAPLWEEVQLSQEGQSPPVYSRRWVSIILSSLKAIRLPVQIQAVVLKEWFILLRNPFTVIRVLAWLGLSLLILIIPSAYSLVSSLQSPLIVVFAIWYFCFGELITTTYQTESNRLALWWLAAISPGQFALAKVLAYLPTAIPAVITAGLMVVFLGVGTWSDIAFSFLGVATGIAVSLLPASLAMNRIRKPGNSYTEVVLEQVPVTLSSVTANILLGGVLIAFVVLDVAVRGSSELKVFPVFLSVIAILLALAATGYALKRGYSL